MPLVLTGRPWVRARFDAVEIPLNRTKKSTNARNICFGPVFVIWGTPLKVQIAVTQSLEMQQRFPVAQSYLRYFREITNGP
ncbi:MAG TPA: hypothetical protein VHX20_10530 [Terracidiphilus sp.]|nr:hypothetical protein [Terracidiphilus sp.]